jgi:hypothetical protein
VLSALGEIGVQEEGCANCGPRVEEYLASVKLGKGFPWCSAALHWSFRQCGTVLTPERRFAAAAQWATKNEVFRRSQLDDYSPLGPGHDWERISEDGDVGVLWDESLGRIGHCFCIVGESEKYVETAEGNSNTNGSREGTTFVRRKRLKRTVHSIHRWP